MRKLVKAGTLDRDGYVINEDPVDFADKVGHPERMDFQHSGVIMPKQKGVDGTYISCWTKMAENSMVNGWAKANCPPPYFIERNPDEDMFGNFTVSPLN